MDSKQAEAALIRMIEEGFDHVAQLPPKRFMLIVTGVEITGSPPRHLVVSGTFFFLKGGEPFCCGEPACYSELFLPQSQSLADFLRSRMHLEHAVTVEMKVSTVYYQGIQFTAFGKRGGYVNCPCCGFRTLDGGQESGQICEVCLWEDLDRQHPDNPTSSLGHNLGLSLNQARDNFRRTGSCHETYQSLVRPPSPDEMKEVGDQKDGLQEA